jgi:hypothetical protein
MLRTHDVVLADGTFRLVMTPKRRVIAAIDAPHTLLGPIHVAVEVDRRSFLPAGAPDPHDVLARPMTYVTAGFFDDIGHAFSDAGKAIGHAAEGAFNTVSHAATTIARPAFDIVKGVTSEGAHLLAHLPGMPGGARRDLDAASRVIMRARLGDLTAKQFVNTIAAAAKAGVKGASHVADALLDASKAVAKVIDVPVALASHVPGLGDVLRSISPFQKYNHMVSALQKGDMKALGKMAQDEIAMAQSVLPLIPGIGTGIGAALAAGMSVLQGGSPLELAIHTAYGAIPIPPGVRTFTDAALNAVLALIAHPHDLTEVGVQVVRDRIPHGLARDVFDTLIQLVVHRVPIQKVGASLVDHFVRQYAPAGEGMHLADALAHAAGGPAMHILNGLGHAIPAGPAMRLVQPLATFVH